jgi:putative tricarboxylic transport membrane protein
MLIAGLVGYLLSKGGFPLSPIVLALILGPMAEGNFRRSLVMSQGSYAIFFQRPISAAFILIAVVSLFYPIIKKTLKDRKAKAVQGQTL